MLLCDEIKFIDTLLLVFDTKILLKSLQLIFL